MTGCTAFFSGLFGAPFLRKILFSTARGSTDSQRCRPALSGHRDGLEAVPTARPTGGGSGGTLRRPTRHLSDYFSAASRHLKFMAKGL